MGTSVRVSLRARGAAPPVSARAAAWRRASRSLSRERCCTDLLSNHPPLIDTSDGIRDRQGSRPVLPAQSDLPERRPDLEIAGIAIGRFRQNLFGASRVALALQERDVAEDDIGIGVG